MTRDKEEHTETLDCAGKERKELESRRTDSQLSDSVGVKLGTRETLEGRVGHYDQQLMEEENSIMLARIRAEFRARGRLQNATTGQLIVLFRHFSLEARRGVDRIRAAAVGEEPQSGKR